MELLDVYDNEVEFVQYMTVSDIEELINTNQMLQSHGVMFRELIKKRRENSK